MLKKFLCILCLISISLMDSKAQSVYMHEAQEEALELEEEGVPFIGIIGTLLLFGTIYVVGNLWDSHKETQKRMEEYKKKKKVSDSIANEHIVNKASISKYQYKEAWQKGYKRAIYDRLYRTPRKLIGKTIDDIIAEYRHACELGHIVQADKIMEEIGYFQCLEQQKSKTNHDQ